MLLYPGTTSPPLAADSGSIANGLYRPSCRCSICQVMVFVPPADCCRCSMIWFYMREPPCRLGRGRFLVRVFRLSPRNHLATVAGEFRQRRERAVLPVVPLLGA